MVTEHELWLLPTTLFPPQHSSLSHFFFHSKLRNNYSWESIVNKRITNQNFQRKKM